MVSYGITILYVFVGGKEYNITNFKHARDLGLNMGAFQ
jgi:hypothetical protein